MEDKNAEAQRDYETCVHAFPTLNWVPREDRTFTGTNGESPVSRGGRVSATTRRWAFGPPHNETVRHEVDLTIKVDSNEEKFNSDTCYTLEQAFFSLKGKMSRLREALNLLGEVDDVLSGV